METQVFDFKFKSFNDSLKFDDNIKWYIHNSKYYEIRKYNHYMFFIFVIVIHFLSPN